jgi:hypothetical protein
MKILGCDLHAKQQQAKILSFQFARAGVLGQLDTLYVSPDVSV